MSILLSSDCLLAIMTAMAGTILFCLAPYLPSLFPHALTRLVGVGSLISALIALWVFTNSWKAPVAVGCCAICVLLIAHFTQTRAPEEHGDDTEEIK